MEDDEYNKKFAKMQEYVPFLEAMIERLQKVKDAPREIQLQKMQSLHGILTNNKRRLRIETLEKCEDILKKLYNKVERGNTPGVQNEGASCSRPSTSKERRKTGSTKSAKSKRAKEDEEFRETPASPTPPVSPDSAMDATPITIPTERTACLEDKSDSKPASPDPAEKTPTKTPIIIPTERTDNDPPLPPRGSCKSPDDQSFIEWDLLEEIEKQVNRNKYWQPTVATSNDVTAAAKLVGSNLPQKKNDGRNHTNRQVPTVPIPSLGGSRRLTSMLENNRSYLEQIITSDFRPDSSTDLSDTIMKSPEPEFPIHANNLPSKIKDTPSRSIVKPPAPLLLSPPPASAKPPLSMEDLAELLSEGDEGKTETECNSTSEKKDKQESTKDTVKLSSKKCLLSSSNAATKGESTKTCEIKGPSQNSLESSPIPSLVTTGVPLENRSRAPSPCSKESRLADNYERHPRQTRDNHNHDDRNSELHQRLQGGVSSEIGSPEVDSKFRMGDSNTNEYCSNQWPSLPVPPPPPPISAPSLPPLPPTKFTIKPKLEELSALTHEHSIGIHQETNVGLNKDSTHINESQLRSNQFPTNMDTSILSPTARPPDINRISRSEEMINTEIPPSVPSGPQPFISPTRFSPSKQSYINLLDENQSHDKTSDKEFIHPQIQGLFDDPLEQIEEEPTLGIPVPTEPMPYPRSPLRSPPLPPSPSVNTRPSTSCPRNKERSGGRDRSMYNKIEPRNIFNRDSRIPDWARDNEMENCTRLSSISISNSSIVSKVPVSSVPIRNTSDHDTRKSEWPRDNYNERDNSTRLINISNVVPVSDVPVSSVPVSNIPVRITSEHDTCKPEWSMDNYNERDNYTRLSNISNVPNVSDVPVSSVPVSNVPVRNVSDHDTRKPEWPRENYNDRDNCTRLSSISNVTNVSNIPVRNSSEWLRDNPNEWDNCSRLSNVSNVNNPTNVPVRSIFDRDTRNPEWLRDNPNERDNCNRFSNISNINSVSNLPVRNISDRDPRLRTEHVVRAQGDINQTSNQSKENSTSIRDPRLARDKHFPSPPMPTPQIPIQPLAPLIPALPIRTQVLPTRSIPTPSVPIPQVSAPPARTSLFPTRLPHVPSVCTPVVSTPPVRTSLIPNQSAAIPPVRTSQLSTLPASNPPISIPMVRAPLFSNASVAGPKPRESFNERRGPRKRSLAFTHRKKQKPKPTPQPIEGHKRTTDVENVKKTQWDKDRMQSPLESLYGVIDTKAKSTQGYSLQKFRIPKIKRNEPSTTQSSEDPKKGDKEEAEVSSSNIIFEDWSGDNNGEGRIEAEEESGGDTLSVTEGDNASENAETSKKKGAEPELSKEMKYFCKKFGIKQQELWKLVKSNKEKKIRKQDSVSGTTEKDSSEAKRVQTKKKKKKKRMIVSDSSEDECLAERLGILNTKDETSIQNDENKKEEDTTTTQSSDIPTKDSSLKETVTQAETPIAEEKEKSKRDKSKKKENITEVSKEAFREESMEEKETKNSKAKTRRRNSLEMLQEDIREMFISEDVVTATGYRQCRTQNQSTSNQSISKKIESDKDDMDIDSDAEDTSSKQKKSTKSRAADEQSKPRGRPRKKRSHGSRQCSKQYVQSSDSEEDQPLAQRTELLQTPTVAPNQETSNDDSEILRRSKRITPKELIKEPRVVVEKADIYKLDSSKVFDSSSDESFGIDVSELNAAVEIALRPEKQSESDVAPSASKKKSNQTSKKSIKKKKSKSIAGSQNDANRLSDDDSLTSDISRSSSVDHVKKANLSGVERNTNEELLSNILVGIAPSKDNADKNSSLTDKGNDADIDDDPGDQHEIPVNTKKPSGHKKKKKKCWQMGILTKKKKKKSMRTSASKTADTDIHDVSTETETNSKMDDSLATKDETSTNVSINLQKNVVAASDNGQSPDLIEESIKQEPMEIEDDKDKSEPNDKEKEGEVDIAYRDLDVKKLSNYVWVGQDRYNCLLCFFVGKNIVHHYKMSHPGKEILISRLKFSDAQLAIQEAKTNDVENSCLKPLTVETCKFRCRFCSMFSEGAAKIALESFYEHCTTHTGEYRFRCNNCAYQTVAKSSMKTHYYKVCRKFIDGFTEATSQDDIPEESYVCGYLCSICNFVQLKKSNVEHHVNLWHKGDSDVHIIKINMSSNVNEEVIAPCNLESEPLDIPEEKVKVEDLIISPIKEPVNVAETRVKEDKDEITEDTKMEESVNIAEVRVKEDKDEITEDITMKEPVNIAETRVKEDKDEITEDITIKEDEIEINDDGRDMEDMVQASSQEQTESKSEIDTAKRPLQMDVDPSLSGNLSVFVCPPELEKKEVEIQLERKRRMEEIIQNIGIKLQRDPSKKGLSITDKLKDKMESNLVMVSNETNSIVDADSSSKTPADPTSSPNATSSHGILTLKSLAETSNINPSEESSTNNQTEVSQMLSINADCDSQSISEGNSTDSTVKDLSYTMVDSKKDQSDAETSENETMGDAAPTFDDDSTSEQSDVEPPADVNLLLKENSSRTNASKDPMLTTIQRLSAHLQATKPLEGFKEEPLSPEKATRAFAIDIPKPPAVIPIEQLVDNTGDKSGNTKKHDETSRESTDSKDSGTPKNFIRLRRLSGDMLSVPVQSSAVQENPLPNKNVNQPSTSEKNESQLKSEEEECSFLKIENVVSLAPRAKSGASESPIINDIRKAVETSPIKTGISLLKKSNSPLILKRINPVKITPSLTKNIQAVSSVPETLKVISVKSISTTPVTTAQLSNFIPIAPKSKILQMENKLSFPLPANSMLASANPPTVTVGGCQPPPNMNYKLVKFVRTPNVVLKPNETSMLAYKLKSANAYCAMLKPFKLSHLYKCMARDCDFTSDSELQFQKHYLHHESLIDKKKQGQFDFQQCAYCYMALKEWRLMEAHIEDKHAHCRFQCAFCFYRAVTASYVQIHQKKTHPGSHRGILIGKLMKAVPLKEEINRSDTIHPYVCKHSTKENAKKICEKFFYVPETFETHLARKHRSLISYTCHVCLQKSPDLSQLILHYRIHGFYKYQCLYCVHGSDYISEMHIHLSTNHSNRLPQILERSLPEKAVKYRTVIDQLLIRTLDDTHNSNDEVIEMKSGGNNDSIMEFNAPSSSSSSHKIIQLPKDVIIVNKEKNEALNKSSSILGAGTSSNILLNADCYLEEISLNEINSSDSGTANLGNTLNNSNVSLISNKELLEINLFNKSKHSTDVTSITPSGGGLFDTSDEFINMNLLDNPDFLRKASNMPVIRKISKEESKLDDSDIEIVEIDDTEVPPSKSIKSEFDKNAEVQPDVKKTNIDSNEKSKTNENIIKENAAKDNKDSKSGSSSTNVRTSVSETKKPLTLEDIKHTGLSGKQLYKCGFEKCDFNALNGPQLRNHMKECSSDAENKTMSCTHCNKRFLKIGFLLEHLKSHGLKRFGCSLCDMRFTLAHQAISHMKTKHKYPHKLVPADPKNPSVDGLFIVQPTNQVGERSKGKKRKRGENPIEKAVAENSEKLIFGPDEIEALPRQAIYNREVQCAVCPYTNKVRMNIMRHLLQHLKDESVPESGPVNPVPCLDKKERMFDKMVNLASSSHQNGRMGGGNSKETNKDKDEEFIPKFVPEHKRYVCGVAECNYLTVDEAMLRCHLKALHSEELYFRCPHCPQPPPNQEGLNIAIDKMGIHLKMHDTRLYKCSHCNHHHYHRHVVERHLSDKHPEKRPFVKVIREFENTETTQQAVPEELEEELPDPDGNHWKCNICDHKCVYKVEMANHASTTHDEKCQYKCNLCSFKTSGKILFEQHVNSKHSTDTDVDYIIVYQRIKGVNKKNTDNTEQSGQEEPFDTTPLWRRDMPRIRHIRGILLEEEEETTQTGKRKSDTESPVSRPCKIKPGKSGSLDESKQTKEKVKRSFSCEKVSTEEESTSNASISPEKFKDGKLRMDDNESDVGKFGPYGKSEGNMYVCTLCPQFKTKYKHDMRDHLYRELNYARWRCKECGYLSVNRNALLKHFGKHHNEGIPNHEPLSPDSEIEKWVLTLLKRQTAMIKEFLTKQNLENGRFDNDVKPVIPMKKPKLVNITGKLSNLKDDNVDNIAIDIEETDESSKEDSVVDNSPKKYDTVKGKYPGYSKKKRIWFNSLSNVAESSDDQEKLIFCKRCKMKFTGWRGLKLHVQLIHLKRLGYICPYCDRSTNSESSMRQHIRSKHPGSAEKLVENPMAGAPELSDEAWQEEYGVVIPKKNRKRARKQTISGGDFAEKSDIQRELLQKCNICNFTAVSAAGLKIHMMKRHVMKNQLKCFYCPFFAMRNDDMYQHWETHHSLLPYKFDEFFPPESSSESIDTETFRKTVVDDYSNDIEEECVVVTRKESVYHCFHCSFNSKNLDEVWGHWSVTHKEFFQDDVNLKINYPFKYKEVKVPIMEPLKDQNIKTETESSYELYLQQSQSDSQEVGTNNSLEEKWICQWCNELCESEVRIQTHHSMFHSHLPLNFKKEEKTKITMGYVCSECPFAADTINLMKNHMSKHINLFKCKYCEKTFNCHTLVSSHNVEEHPNKELKIESINNYEDLVDMLMSKVIWQKCDVVTLESRKKRPAVAKKSTAKNTSRPSFIRHRINAVARKSINPQSKCVGFLVSNTVNDEEEPKNNQVSHYGIPSAPVDLAKLNTSMVVGGHEMKVNCTTLSQLIDINPKIILKDLKYENIAIRKS